MKQIIFRDKKIFYKAEGKGCPVILLHGFAETSDVWNDQLEKLKEYFFVIIPDLPGSGKSEMLEGNISINDYAEAIKAIADTEINSNKPALFSLIGHSMGGYITLAFAEKYPKLLNGFGLFHSSAYADDDAKKETRKKGIEFIENNGAGAFIKTTTPNLFSEKTKNKKPELIENLIQLAKGFSGDALVQYYHAMMARPERINVLKNFKKPVLFIIGKDDNAVPLKASLGQCHLPSVSFIKILESSGHMGMWEEKDEANKFVLNFLKHV